MTFLATASLPTFGSALAGQTVRRAPSSTVLAPRQPVAPIECKCRRNLKKEKFLRNRARANELRRMKKNPVDTRFKRFNDDAPANSPDFINPFHYDARGEPINSSHDEA
mmetsp:Transcript_22397/g.62104  ORF Transcript_22397/g.62104 Transcript_22397/m.62104 type:complete len:109 (-) Transcript_22397:254-580(-)|eukprot:CAMPEP_0117664176 /NCGR_PEP_ID=MMETSP0804-20121206/9061_1 /TAXON_ID=1074897 /ORGANISM="Tetraselmis astigmatica, Strain CCMP880" /LENGTH=108 /DNA_ID=CAMNT_0005471353 /DNA_START=103 /DNA_END=429 /DNA_ORIENTATION=+